MIVIDASKSKSRIRSSVPALITSQNHLFSQYQVWESLTSPLSSPHRYGHNVFSWWSTDVLWVVHHSKEPVNCLLLQNHCVCQAALKHSYRGTAMFPLCQVYLHTSPKGPVAEKCLSEVIFIYVEVY